MTTLRYAKSAERAIFDAAIRWSADHPAAPHKFDEEVTRALELIMLFPEIAPRTLTTRFKNSRKYVLVETGYLLIYRLESKHRVRVLALLASRATRAAP